MIDNSDIPSGVPPTTADIMLAHDEFNMFRIGGMKHDIVRPSRTLTFPLTEHVLNLRENRTHALIPGVHALLKGVLHFDEGDDQIPERIVTSPPFALMSTSHMAGHDMINLYKFIAVNAASNPKDEDEVLNYFMALFAMDTMLVITDIPTLQRREWSSPHANFIVLNQLDGSPPVTGFSFLESGQNPANKPPRLELVNNFEIIAERGRISPLCGVTLDDGEVTVVPTPQEQSGVIPFPQIVVGIPHEVPYDKPAVHSNLPAFQAPRITIDELRAIHDHDDDPSSGVEEHTPPEEPAPYRASSPTRRNII